MSTSSSSRTEKIVYDDGVVRKFVFASIAFGIVAMLVGAIAALQLAFHQANVHPYLSFGRLRPLHTNAAIFAFVGNMMFAGVYYSTQRLTKQRLFSNVLTNLHFWGWQLIIVAAAVTLPLGMTQGKEYAELEWPIDLAITAVWVIFAINFFGTLWKRNEKNLYVALWFYISTIVTVAVLHIVNSMAIPISPFKSYSLFGGAKDALIQWWYGHNAVAFFLTTPILGIMYYFVPKAADRPVYSYRLSVVHFWSLVFMYIWAGPHHLLNTALPDWAQTLGMVFSVMLWAPSWGGMLNGLLTLRGAWQKLRTDPVLKFFAAGITFYGMATFEGPLLSIKSVSGLAHYTDWIIGHVHGGALGWNGLMAAGMFYWLIPRLYGTKLRSTRAADIHFWLGTFGIVLYMVAMWVGGITQGMMWRAQRPDGGLLYQGIPGFVETLVALKPMYWMRLVGGTMYLVGFVMMGWNLIATARSGKPVDGETTVVIEGEEADSQGKTGAKVRWTEIVFAQPVVISFLVLATLACIAFTSAIGAGAFMLFAGTIAFFAIFFAQLSKKPGESTWHALLEGRALLFTVLTAIAVLIGGAAEIIPALVVQQTDGAATAAGRPYRPLELEGRDIYLREGCYVCHSQMIRPFTWETQRYGEVSAIGDSVYDHPFQWGSKRTGPDLAREGGRNPNEWHYTHLIDPRSVVPQSNMPPYAHTAKWKLDFTKTADKLRAMRAVGVPYTPEQIAAAATDAKAQADGIVADLATKGITVAPDAEIVALIAYLQKLGTNAPATKTAAPITQLAPPVSSTTSHAD